MGEPGTFDRGWYCFDDTRIRPLAEPADVPGAPAARRDAVRVPAELAGPPGTDPADSCWRLGWLRIGGAWCSALITARRRPAPGMPWIAHARWGEDKQAAWIVVDNAVLRLVPPEPVPAAQDDGRPR
ncbi:hypothetical protein [Kitasatospora aureofaciens]|uniref:hypothetical protein n=1 Tax=Kitasatospora aureofaciens TaxID=1894 RepID=UPI001C46479B|nr:hypothetical protein [Kitasatospora aureofaciens]